MANSCGLPESTYTSATPTRGGEGRGGGWNAGTQCHFPRDAMEGHLGGTGVDGRQLTAGRGEQRTCTPKKCILVMQPSNGV